MIQAKDSTCLPKGREPPCCSRRSLSLGSRTLRGRCTSGSGSGTAAHRAHCCPPASRQAPDARSWMSQYARSGTWGESIVKWRGLKNKTLPDYVSDRIRAVIAAPGTKKKTSTSHLVQLISQRNYSTPAHLTPDITARLMWPVRRQSAWQTPQWSKVLVYRILSIWLARPHWPEDVTKAQGQASMHCWLVHLTYCPLSAGSWMLWSWEDCFFFCG